MKELILATNNLHKLNEIQRLLPTDIILRTLKDVEIFETIEETGKTLNENAFLKANYVYRKTRKNVFADDSGLEVDALNGAPGVYSSCYAGEEGNSKKNNEKLLEELKEVTNRKARFRCCIALIWEHREYFFEGIVEGKIISTPIGNNGFGYDPIFMPDGYNITFAQMSTEEKNAISHRSIAIAKMIDFLKHTH